MKVLSTTDSNVLKVPFKYLTPYVRNSSYLNFTDPLVSDEKLIGLFAIYETGNYCVMTVAGAYSVNYGDGTATQNYAANIKAEYNIPYANIAGNTDIGIATAQLCTFTTGTNIVTLTNHGWENLQTISFNIITTTGGISLYVKYWIINITTNTFQLSLSPNGNIAIILTANGTGSIYIPMHRQAIITMTMQVLNTLTFIDLSTSFTGSNNGYCSQWIDLSIAGQLITNLKIATSTPGSLPIVRINHNQLEQFKLISSDLRQCNNLFSSLYALKTVNLNFCQTTAISFPGSTLTTGTNIVTTGISNSLRIGDSVIFSSSNVAAVISGIIYYVKMAISSTGQM